MEGYAPWSYLVSQLTTEEISMKFHTGNLQLNLQKEFNFDMHRYNIIQILRGTQSCFIILLRSCKKLVHD